MSADPNLALIVVAIFIAALVLRFVIALILRFVLIGAVILAAIWLWRSEVLRDLFGGLRAAQSGITAALLGA